MLALGIGQSIGVGITLAILVCIIAGLLSTPRIPRK